MWHTHAAIGASAVWLLFLPPDNSVSVGVLTACAIIGALMPDLDATQSKIKHVSMVGIRPLVPLSVVAHREFGHRGFLHSIGGWVLWTISLIPLVFWISWLPVTAMSVGYASHLAGDSCTRTGIPLLFPQHKKMHLMPRNLRVTTGSEIEEAIFVLFAMLSMCILLRNIGL